MRKKLAVVQLALADAMSEVSEDLICAEWLHGLEFYLWGQLMGMTGFEFAPDPVPAEDLANLRSLHDAAGGWCMWDGERGPVFVPTKEWLQKFSAYVEELAV